MELLFVSTRGVCRRVACRWLQCRDLVKRVADSGKLFGALPYLLLLLPVLRVQAQVVGATNGYGEDDDGAYNDE